MSSLLVTALFVAPRLFFATLFIARLLRAVVLLRFALLLLGRVLALWSRGLALLIGTCGVPALLLTRLVRLALLAALFVASLIAPFATIALLVVAIVTRVATPILRAHGRLGGDNGCRY